MKQKTTFITLSLVVAILALGVAYAAITTQTLNVVGNVAASASSENFDVRFSGNPATPTLEYTGNVEGHVNAAVVSATASGKTGHFDISGLTTKGDKVTIVYPISNVSPDLGATLSEVTVTGETVETEKWYEVTTSLSSKSLSSATAEPLSNTANLTITVELLDTPKDDSEAPKASYYVEFTADPA